jgi:flagellar biosynthetic protein FlhB
MSDKTEKPSQRKLEKSRKDGKFPISREFVSAAQFLVFVWLIGNYGPIWFRTTSVNFRLALTAGFRGDLTPVTIQQLAWNLARGNLFDVLFAGIALTGTILIAQIFTTNLGISLAKLSPDFTRLNPISRITQLPSQNIPKLLEALALLPLFGFAVYAIVNENLPVFATLSMSSTVAGAQRMGHSIMSLLWRAAMLFMVFGLVDLFRQRKKHASGLKMTKQEIRDESKDAEGNPQVKQRIRRIQRDFARRTMMKEVPTATAVIVNPTHYSVAIRYSVDSLGAPMVVAKGKNYLARRIRELALEHNVPIVENQPLAQALYKSVNVGQEIPAHLYRAVAEILAYLYRLMNGKL